jgi:hypothetical protein
LKPVAGAQGPNVSDPVRPRVYSSRHGDVVYAVADMKTAILGLDVHYYADSLPTNFNWRQISGPTTVNHSFKSMDGGFVYSHVDNLDYGTYTFEAMIADEAGNAKTETLKVTYPRPVVPTGVNQAPRVTLSADRTLVVRPTTYAKGPVNHIESREDFAFQGVALDDGVITSYKWTQLSGPTQLNIVSEFNQESYYGLKFRNHTYGTYELKLEVTDDQGAKGSSTILITFPRGI